MNFLTNINLNGNELQNVIIQNLPQDPNPTSLKQGQFWYNSSTHQLKYAALVEEEIKAIVIGEGEVTDEELANLAQKVTALENTVNGTEEIIGLVEEVTALKETVNGTEGQPSLNEQISDALTKAENAKKAADSAQAAADSAQAAADAAQESANSKVEKVNGSVDNIIVFCADGTIKDGGKTIQQVIDEAIAASAGEGEEIDLTGYIQKVSGAVEGNLSSLAADGSLVDSGYSVKGTLLSEGSAEIPTSSAVALYITEQLSGITQGIVFRGILNSSNSITTPYNIGDMYYIGEAGTYFDYNCEVGDVFIAKVAKQEGEVVAKEDWSILESNKDVFQGATDSLIGTSGLVPAPPSGAKKYLDSTGTWSAPLATRYAEFNPVLNPDSNNSITWRILHNLNNMDVQVIVYRVADGKYEQVMCDVTLFNENECRVYLISSNEITAGTYRVVVM